MVISGWFPVALGADVAKAIFHAAPKPLPAGAVTSDWPRFLGSKDDATSSETKLLRKWPEGGPTKVWEVERGEGYTCPAIAGGKLVLFHRVGDEEVVECRNAETGAEIWRFAYPVEYRDRYGYNNGPRASPVIDGGNVYVVGVTARLHCLALDGGKVVWERDLMKEYAVTNNFFGYGPTPVVWKDSLLVSVGGPEVSVCALDKMTGKEKWRVKDEWSASYSSPVVKPLLGKPRLLVFAGGESRPATGGLIVLDPDTGAVLDRFPWRADKYESVNASTPIVVGENRVYISECYETGGVMLEFDEEMKAKPVWKERWFGMHWMTPVQEGKYLFGFAGRNEPDVEFKCANAETGEIVWKEDLRWEEKIGVDVWVRSYFRGSLLKVDGSYLCLGEHGTLAWMTLSPEGVQVDERAQLFLAQHSWTLPAVSQGLLYVCQNERDELTKTPARLICYDLRGE
jgi:outer membrane protein assembly factor BamB